MIGAFVQLNLDSKYATSHPLGYVIRGDGCWEWVGATSKGYAVWRQKGKPHSVHRFLYEQQVGPIPPGSDLDHLCRNIICVNPAHGEPVTHGENLLRGNTVNARAATRTHCPAGHEYDQTNNHGGRRCRQCGRARQRVYNRTVRAARRRAAREAA